MRKSLLINLYKLKNTNCGLGQVSLNYGKYLEENYQRDEHDFDIYLLLPKEYIGQFGDQVRYIRASWWRRVFPFLMPRFTAWHSTYQMAKFWPFFKGTKVILTIHDFNFIYEKSKLKSNIYLRRIRKEIKNATRIIAISEFTRNETMQYANVDSDDIKIVYNGVENIVDNATSVHNGIDDKKPFFFTIGQIKEKKNFHTLIPVMKHFPDVNLYIAGQKNTDYAARLEAEIADLGLKNVILLGEVTESEKTWLYRHCKAFFFPSLFEGFGLPVIEALSFGKPVFSSNQTSLKEIGQDCVYYWENFDSEYMFQVVNSNLTKFYDSLQKGAEAKEHAAQFSYEEHFKKYFAIYNECLSSMD